MKRNEGKIYLLSATIKMHFFAFGHSNSLIIYLSLFSLTFTLPALTRSERKITSACFEWNEKWWQKRERDESFPLCEVNLMNLKRKKHNKMPVMFIWEILSNKRNLEVNFFFFFVIKWEFFTFLFTTLHQVDTFLWFYVFFTSSFVMSMSVSAYS